MRLRRSVQERGSAFLLYNTTVYPRFARSFAPGSARPRRVAVADRWRGGCGTLGRRGRLVSVFDFRRRARVAERNERARPERDRTHRIRCGPSWVWRCALRDLSRGLRPRASVTVSGKLYCHTGILDRASRRALDPLLGTGPRLRVTLSLTAGPRGA